MDLYDLNEIPDRLKSYFEPAPQIGLEATPEEFIDTMVRVFREVRRVTRPDGVLWLNLGDSYCSNGVYIEKYKESHPEHTDLHTKNSERYQNRKGVRGGYYDLKAKDLMGIPWRVSFALQADGWYFRSAMPWIKRSCMPESTTDRPTSAIEYIFLMTKSAKYYYDGEAIRVPSVTPIGDDRSSRADSRRNVPGANRISAKKQDQTGNPTYTGFNERYKNRKQADCAPEVSGGSKNLKGHSGNFKADGTPFSNGTRNYRNSDPFFESWQGLYSEGGEPLALIVNPQARPELHFASFPDKLAETFIKAGTSEYGCCPKCGAPWQRVVECSGGTTDGYKREFKGWKPGCSCDAGSPLPCLVLDPFMGSGTVAVVARELNRSSVGCELNPEYIKIIKKRLQSDSCLDTGTVNYRFEKVPPP